MGRGPAAAKTSDISLLKDGEGREIEMKLRLAFHILLNSWPSVSKVDLPAPVLPNTGIPGENL